MKRTEWLQETRKMRFGSGTLYSPRRVFSKIPNATTVDDFESLLPGNVHKDLEKSKDT